MIYIATPYSHSDEAVRELRYKHACVLWRYLLVRGHDAFSPIVHAHPTAVRYAMPKGHEFWERWNRGMLDLARELIVAELPGWEESKGVRKEMAHAYKRKLLVTPWKNCGHIIESYGLPLAPDPDLFLHGAA